MQCCEDHKIRILEVYSKEIIQKRSKTFIHEEFNYGIYNFSKLETVVNVNKGYSCELWCTNCIDYYRVIKIVLKTISKWKMLVGECVKYKIGNSLYGSCYNYKNTSIWTKTEQG